jgi:hypothetical protein
MNERIRDLAEQSGMIYYSKTKALDNANDGMTVIPSLDGLEKFAELIVQECVEVVKWTPSLYSNDEYVKNIKTHFGVEE